MLEHAGAYVAERCAFQAVAFDQRCKRGRQHLLVARFGVRPHRARERDAQAADNRHAAHCRSDEHDGLAERMATSGQRQRARLAVKAAMTISTHSRFAADVRAICVLAAADRQQPVRDRHAVRRHRDGRAARRPRPGCARRRRRLLPSVPVARLRRADGRVAERRACVRCE